MTALIGTTVLWGVFKFIHTFKEFYHVKLAAVTGAFVGVLQWNAFLRLGIEGYFEFATSTFL